ncbi:putative MYND domain protein [Cladophialophora carrionii]|uniref:Putative MYND domain protein n=1 Tax=Cladophialophora carrionii TaxID=86049 RepID=A0A1C1CAQ1_9EURO|nr:putative MYND domain protein [Cladophialophora carrionii]
MECAACRKPATDSAPLKRCAKCHTTKYCSQDCQKDDWKHHKKSCSRLAAARSGATPGPSTNTPSATPTNTNNSTNPTSDTTYPGLSAPQAVPRPFHALSERKFLHNRAEDDVYKLLVDCYRFRVEDDYVFAGHVEEDCIYGGAPDSYKPFQRFLRKAEGRDGLLPSWWTSANAKACLEYGKDPRNWSDLCCAIEKHDVTEHYGDNLMPMKLRMLGEQILGTGPGGQSGAAMMQLQTQAERGSMLLSHLELSQMFR